MKPISLLILCVALALGGLATYFGRVIVSRSTPQPVEEARVVVAVSPMGFGTELTEANVAEVPWPATVVPEGAFRSKAELFKEGRRVVLNPVAKSEPILATKITGSGQRASLAALLDEGKRAVTLRVDDVRGVAGFVRPGDRVDVILTQQSNGAAVADVLLQNIKVLAVDQVANERQENATVARAVTIEVNTEEAQKIVLAQGVGNLALVLRQPDMAVSEGVKRVTTADLGSNTETPAEKSKVAQLEAQIAELKAMAAKSDEAGRKEFLYRIAQLESRMTSELSRNSVRPAEPAPKTAKETVVRVTRGVKPEEYRFVGE